MPKRKTKSERKSTGGNAPRVDLEPELSVTPTIRPLAPAQEDVDSPPSSDASDEDSDEVDFPPKRVHPTYLHEGDLDRDSEFVSVTYHLHHRNVPYIVPSCSGAVSVTMAKTS